MPTLPALLSPDVSMASEQRFTFSPVNSICLPLSVTPSPVRRRGAVSPSPHLGMPVRPAPPYVRERSCTNVPGVLADRLTGKGTLLPAGPPKRETVRRSLHATNFFFDLAGVLL